MTGVHPRAWPWPVQVLLVYGAARILSAGVLLAAAAVQAPSPWAAASPGYLSFVAFWDSGWYERIFEEGYPPELPRDIDGAVSPNQWAFYPLFPALVRLLHSLTGAGWPVLAPIAATACGFAAALVIYRLFRLAAEPRDALWGVAFVAFLPVSPILQIPYAESLNLLLLALSLLLVFTRRYLTAVPVVVAMCLSRPAGVPFALLLLILFVIELLALRRRPPDAPADRKTGSGPLRLAVLGLVTGAAALAWPAAAWAVTGEANAYVETETAWRGEELAPFAPWPNAAVAYLGPVGGPLALLVLAAGCFLLFRSRPVRSLGAGPVSWCAAYLVYLAAFWNPQSSTFRILLPLFPLALAAALASRSPAYRWAVLAVCLVLQIVWVRVLWAWSPVVGNADYPP